MPELTLEAVVVRRGEPLTAEVDEELVMLDPREGRYFGADRIGRRIWELLEQPRTVDDPAPSSRATSTWPPTNAAPTCSSSSRSSRTPS